MYIDFDRSRPLDLVLFGRATLLIISIRCRIVFHSKNISAALLQILRSGLLASGKKSAL